MMARVSTNQARMARCQLRARQLATRSRSGACGGRCRQTETPMIASPYDAGERQAMALAPGAGGAYPPYSGGAQDSARLIQAILD